MALLNLKFCMACSERGLNGEGWKVLVIDIRDSTTKPGMRKERRKVIFLKGFVALSWSRFSLSVLRRATKKGMRRFFCRKALLP